MPLLRPSPSDYTAVVKSLAVAGAAVSNPQGSRPPSKGSVAFVNVASVAALIRGSPRLVTMSAPKAIGPPGPPTLPIDPNKYTVYTKTLVFAIQFNGGGLVRDASGNFYGRPSSLIFYKVAPNSTQTFLAGDGDGSVGTFIPGLGSAARFGGNGGVKSLVIDSSGNIFTVHTNTHRIIKIEPNGNVTSYAGTGTAGFGDGDRTIATFTSPWGIAIDASNTLYVAENDRKTIRKISPSGQVSTLTFTSSFAPRFQKIAVDSLGVIYANDIQLHRVYKITPTGPSTADLALLAGSTQGYRNGQGSVAQFSFASDSSLCVDRFGNVYVGDTNNGSIRKITPNGNVITIIGDGVQGVYGDETGTQLFQPKGLILDTDDIYVTTGSSVQKISPVS